MPVHREEIYGRIKKEREAGIFVDGIPSTHTFVYKSQTFANVVVQIEADDADSADEVMTLFAQKWVSPETDIKAEMCGW